MLICRFTPRLSLLELEATRDFTSRILQGQGPMSTTAPLLKSPSEQTLTCIILRVSSTHPFLLGSDETKSARLLALCGTLFAINNSASHLLRHKTIYHKIKEHHCWGEWQPLLAPVLRNTWSCATKHNSNYGNCEHVLKILVTWRRRVPIISAIVLTDYSIHTIVLHHLI